MAKYKISFAGFAYVEADDPAEAEEKLEYEDYIFLEHEITEITEVDEFLVEV